MLEFENVMFAQETAILSNDQFVFVTFKNKTILFIYGTKTLKLSHNKESKSELNEYKINKEL